MEFDKDICGCADALLHNLICFLRDMSFIGKLYSIHFARSWEISKKLIAPVITRNCVG